MASLAAPAVILNVELCPHCGGAHKPQMVLYQRTPKWDDMFATNGATHTIECLIRRKRVNIEEPDRRARALGMAYEPDDPQFLHEDKNGQWWHWEYEAE